MFFQNIIQSDGSILDLVGGKYTFLNERLARHYGIKSVIGAEFRKVDLTGTKRTGVLTQASVLTILSYGNRTSPVRHLVYPETPMTNLFLTMLDKMGVPTEKLGDSTGKLEYLSI